MSSLSLFCKVGETATGFMVYNNGNFKNLLFSLLWTSRLFVSMVWLHIILISDVYSLSSSAAGYSESYAKEQDNSTTGAHHWLHLFDNENSSKFPELLKLQCLNIDAVLFNHGTLTKNI